MTTKDAGRTAPESEAHAGPDSAAETQAQLSAEIEAGHRAYQEGLDRGDPQKGGWSGSVGWSSVSAVSSVAVGMAPGSVVW